MLEYFNFIAQLWWRWRWSGSLVGYDDVEAGHREVTVLRDHSGEQAVMQKQRCLTIFSSLCQSFLSRTENAIMDAENNINNWAVV